MEKKGAVGVLCECGEGQGYSYSSLSERELLMSGVSCLVHSSWCLITPHLLERPTTIIYIYRAHIAKKLKNIL